MLSANQEDCELRYPRKTTRILTVVAFAGIAIVVYLAQWALRNTESGSVALGAAVFAVIGAVMTVSLLQARRWLRERVVARAESLRSPATATSCDYRNSGHAASLKSPICATSARLNAGRAVPRST